MPCTTPSHEETIKEGVSCTVEDTLRELEQATQKSRNDICLLGEGQPTFGKTIDNKLIEGSIKKLQQQRKVCGIEFLKAQMHQDYKSVLNSGLPKGTQQTKEIITSSITPTSQYEFYQIGNNYNYNNNNTTSRNHPMNSSPSVKKLHPSIICRH